MRPVFIKLSVLQGAVVGYGNLLHTPLLTKYPTEKRYYLKTKLFKILIGKRVR